MYRVSERKRKVDSSKLADKRILNIGIIFSASVGIYLLKI